MVVVPSVPQVFSGRGKGSTQPSFHLLPKPPQAALFDEEPQPCPIPDLAVPVVAEDGDDRFAQRGGLVRGYENV